jgi:hypothetical protein
VQRYAPVPHPVAAMCSWIRPMRTGTSTCLMS